MTSEMQDIQSKLDKCTEEKNALAEVCLTNSYIKFCMNFMQSIGIIGSFITSLSVAQFVRFVTIPVFWSQINRSLIKNQQVWREKVKEIEERYSLFYPGSMDIIILLFSCPKGGIFFIVYVYMCTGYNFSLLFLHKKGENFHCVFIHVHSCTCNSFCIHLLFFEIVVSSVACLYFCLTGISFWLFSVFFFGFQILHGVFIFHLGKLLN